MMVNPDGSRDFFNQYRIFNVGALYRLINCGIPKLFPKLRFGFIEAAASWTPFLIHILRRLLKEKWQHGTSADLFREYRLYIACEADEDIPYIAKYTGEDHLLIGSDYPHSDPSREDQFVNAITVREDISPQLRQKLLYDNPREFYTI